MGLKKRVIPDKLPGKLKRIRLALGLTLEELVVRLERELAEFGYKSIKIYTGSLTECEQGKREVQLPVLLAYGQIANVYVEVLLDDRLELPVKLPVSEPKTFD